MKATAEQDGNELVNFIALSAVWRLSAKSPWLTFYLFFWTRRSTCDPQHFSDPSVCLH